MGRRALVLAIALLLGLVAAFSIWRWLNGIEAEFQAGQTVVPVYRAVAPIPEGSTGAQILQSITISLVESTEQQQDLPGDFIGSKEELESILRTRVAVGPISANEILVQSQWAELSVQITPLVDLIDTGLEAVTVSPDVVSGVNGFVRPGDKVNIIVTLSIEFNLTTLGQQAPQFGIPSDVTADGSAAADQVQEVDYTRYVLHQVPVIAVGRQVTAAAGATASVVGDTTASAADQGSVQGGQVEETVSSVFTLALPPEEIERLIFAQNAGQLYYTLIPADYVLVETKGVTIQTLFAGDLVEDIFG